MHIATLSMPAERPRVATTHVWPSSSHLSQVFFAPGMCMGESGDALIRPVILLVVHVRLACGGGQAMLCGASSRRCKPFWISVCHRPKI